MKKLLLNPFENYSEKQLLLIGVFGNILLIFLSFQFNTEFIGNLKSNPLNEIVLKDVILQHLIILTLTAFLFFVLGKYLNSKTRFIDVFATCLVSRIVFCIIPLVNLNNKMYEITKRVIGSLATVNPEKAVSNDLPLLLFFAGIALISMVWFFILLYNGFKTATNAKGSKSIILFITTIIITEILTRILIINLF